MNIYHRLNLQERETISRLLSQNCSFNTIANQLNRNVSTISREVNGDGKNRYLNKYFYRGTKGQNRARRKSSQRRRGRRKIDKNQDLKKIVLEKLRLKWSPEQIAKSLKKDYSGNKDMNISPEAIYTYIYVLLRGEIKKAQHFLNGWPRKTLNREIPNEVFSKPLR